MCFKCVSNVVVRLSKIVQRLFNGSQGLFKCFRRLSTVFGGLQGLFNIFGCCQWFSMLFDGSKRFSKVVQGLSRVVQGFSTVFKCFQMLFNGFQLVFRHLFEGLSRIFQRLFDGFQGCLNGFPKVVQVLFDGLQCFQGCSTVFRYFRRFSHAFKTLFKGSYGFVKGCSAVFNVFSKVFQGFPRVVSSVVRRFSREFPEGFPRVSKGSPRVVQGF